MVSKFKTEPCTGKDTMWSVFNSVDIALNQIFVTLEPTCKFASSLQIAVCAFDHYSWHCTISLTVTGNGVKALSNYVLKSLFKTHAFSEDHLCSPDTAVAAGYSPLPHQSSILRTYFVKGCNDNFSFVK